MILTPKSRSFCQLSINLGQSSAKMGKPGVKRSGNLFVARSPTKASPVLSNMLTDPEEWPGVGKVPQGYTIYYSVTVCSMLLNVHCSLLSRLFKSKIL